MFCPTGAANGKTGNTVINWRFKEKEYTIRSKGFLLFQRFKFFQPRIEDLIAFRFMFYASARGNTIIGWMVQEKEYFAVITCLYCKTQYDLFALLLEIIINCRRKLRNGQLFNRLPGSKKKNTFPGAPIGQTGAF